MIRKLIVTACAALALSSPAHAVPPASIPAPPAAAAQYPARAPRIGFAGDSIAVFIGKMSENSPIFWANLAKNRRWDFDTINGNFAVAGTSSGTTTCPGDMNCSTQLAAEAAYDPDVMVYETGKNENRCGTVSSGVSTTLANVVANVNNIITNQPTKGRLRTVIIVPITPGTGGSTVGSYSAMSQGQVDSCTAYRQGAIALARSNPIYHVFDLAAFMLDNSVTGYASIGGAGTAGSATFDYIHPSTLTGRRAAAAWNAFLDTIGGFDVEPVTPLAPLDIYNATSQPGGNMLGGSATFSYGVMVNGGTASGVGTTGTSQYPSGFTNSSTNSSNAELKWTGTVNQTFTDTKTGLSRVGWRTVIGDGTTLTADRTFKTFTGLTAGNFAFGKSYEARVHIKKTAGCVGLSAVYYNIALSYASNPTQTWQIGARPNNSGSAATASDIIDNATDEDWDFHMPTMTPSAAPTGASLGIYWEFMNGTAPNACTFYVSDVQVRAIK